MKDCKLYICTALFVCLTAVKLCFPESTACLQQGARELFSQQADYRELVQAMGRTLNNGAMDDRLVQAIARLKGNETISASHTAEEPDHAG